MQSTTPAQPRQYGAAQARFIMKLADECAGGFNFLEFRDNAEVPGVFMSETYADVFPSGARGIEAGRLLAWNPAIDMENGPDPATWPLLPATFTARDLAAFLVYGVGTFIHDVLGPVGAFDEAALDNIGGSRDEWARQALREAYALAAGALASVGPAEAFGESDDDAEQQLANWRRAMVRELLEGAEGGHEAGRKTGDEQTHQEQAAPAKPHKPRGRKPSDARTLLGQILDALDSYAAATGQDFDRNAMPGPLGESYDDEGSFHWLCARIHPRTFKREKPTFAKHRAGLCALAPYAKPTDFYRLALPHIAPKLGITPNVHHMPKQGRKAA